MHSFILLAAVVLMIGAAIASLCLWCLQISSAEDKPKPGKGMKIVIFIAIMFGWWTATIFIIVGVLWFWDLFWYWPENVESSKDFE